MGEEQIAQLINNKNVLLQSKEKELSEVNLKLNLNNELLEKLNPN
jgi:hypothetical protein